MEQVQALAILRSMGILPLMYKNQEHLNSRQFVFEMYYPCREPSLEVDVDSNTDLSVM